MARDGPPRRHPIWGRCGAKGLFACARDRTMSEDEGWVAAVECHQPTIE